MLRMAVLRIERYRLVNDRSLLKPAKNTFGQRPQQSKAFGHQISKIRNRENKRSLTMCLTFRKGFNSRANKVELLQADQKPKAFGHHISKIRN